jgi:hypothetical protein
MLRFAILLMCTSTYGKPAPLMQSFRGKARVGKARRIHDQAVEAFVDSLIDAINRFPLDVGVEDFQLVGGGRLS